MTYAFKCGEMRINMKRHVDYEELEKWIKDGMYWVYFAYYITESGMARMQYDYYYKNDIIKFRRCDIPFVLWVIDRCPFYSKEEKLTYIMNISSDDYIKDTWKNKVFRTGIIMHVGKIHAYEGELETEESYSVWLENTHDGRELKKISARYQDYFEDRKKKMVYHIREKRFQNYLGWYVPRMRGCHPTMYFDMLDDVFAELEKRKSFERERFLNKKRKKKGDKENNNK